MNEYGCVARYKIICSIFNIGEVVVFLGSVFIFFHPETWKVHCHSGTPKNLINRSKNITSDFSSLDFETFWGAIPFGAGFLISWRENNQIFQLVGMLDCLIPWNIIYGLEIYICIIKVWEELMYTVSMREDFTFTKIILVTCIMQYQNCLIDELGSNNVWMLLVSVAKCEN